MKSYRRSSRILLCIFVSVAFCLATRVYAQLFTFSGNINFSSSSAWTVGEEIKLSFGLTGEPPFQFQPNRFSYHSVSSLLIGGVEYNVGALPYIGEHTVPGYSGMGGGITYVGGFANPLSMVKLNFGSSINVVTDAKGLLLTGLPLNNFEQNIGYLYDTTEFQVGGLTPTVTSFAFTSYSVSPTATSAVPEPGTYGIAGALLLAGVGLVRRRSGAC